MKKVAFILAILIPLSIGACQKEASANPSDCVIGAPNPLIICTADYTPVCGCNQQTYSNSCVAEAAGVKTYTSGKCP